MNRNEKINLYLERAEEIANDNSHGYDNRVNHNLGYPDFDCGTFVSECLHSAGLCEGEILEPNEPYGAWGYDRILTGAGFVQIPFSFAKVQRGDVLIKDSQHTELVYNAENKLTIGAHDNYDGCAGDGYGNEISIDSMSGYWDFIYRLRGEEDEVIHIRARGFGELHGWLEEVVNNDDTIGLQYECLCGVAIDFENIRYAVHDRYNKWNEEVTDYDIHDYYRGFAGDGEPIDGLIIFSDKPIKYRAKILRTQEWLPWVDSRSANYYDDINGFAGIIGKSIDEIEIKLEDC